MSENELPSDSRACPTCGETIKRAAVKCRFCGGNLPAAPEPATAGGERDLFTGRPALLLSVGEVALVVVTLGIAAIYFALRRASMRYRITTQRVQIERGILSRTRINVELYRVDDYAYLQPLGMRLVGQSALRLKTSDRDLPEVRIAGVPGLGELAETLRECSLRERERRGIRVWTNA